MVSEQLAQERKGALRLMEIGVGIATGPVIAGGFGGSGRMGYSVNGGAVSLAAAHPGPCRQQYGPALIVAEETRRRPSAALPFWKWTTIAAGARPPVTLYAMLGNPVARASPKFRALTLFHEHIFQAIAQASNWPRRAS